MEREGMTPSRFAETIGIQRASMSHILNGRNNVSLDVLLKILERFDYLNSDWLLFGKGDILREHSTEPSLLFEQTPVNPSNQPKDLEYRREMGVETTVNSYKQPINEPVMRIERTSRDVSKIMIFYSDNTFDTFTPEKNKKD